jgi:hypothetical protein
VPPSIANCDRLPNRCSGSCTDVPVRLSNHDWGMSNALCESGSVGGMRSTYPSHYSVRPQLRIGVGVFGVDSWRGSPGATGSECRTTRAP